jgi:diguanylate cyclase (GGDEF)-like protein/PAS domain S-box-containing protein
MISMTDKNGIITDCTEAFCQFNGYSKEELLGEKHSLFKHSSNKQHFYQELWNTINAGKIFKAEYQNKTKDGRTVWVDNIITPNFDASKNICGFTSVLKDITDKKEISELLITDYMTNLYNRRYFNTIFNNELKRSRRHRYNFVLMIIDIDFFKQFNDTYGHQAGDEALIKVAKVLKEGLNRPEDYVFRLGGEEFGIITSDIDEQGALSLANKLKKNVSDLRIKHNASSVHKYLTISLGIKLVQYDVKLTYNVIYQQADDALYTAKKMGRDQICI